MNRRKIGVTVTVVALLFVLAAGWTCPLEFLVGAYAAGAAGGLIAVW